MPRFDNHWTADPVERKWKCPKCRFVKRAEDQPTCPNHPYDDMERDN